MCYCPYNCSSSDHATPNTGKFRLYKVQSMFIFQQQCWQHSRKPYGILVSQIGKTAPWNTEQRFWETTGAVCWTFWRDGEIFLFFDNDIHKKVWQPSLKKARSCPCSVFISTQILKPLIKTALTEFLLSRQLDIYIGLKSFGYVLAISLDTESANMAFPRGMGKPFEQLRNYWEGFCHDGYLFAFKGHLSLSQKGASQC